MPWTQKEHTKYIETKYIPQAALWKYWKKPKPTSKTTKKNSNPKQQKTPTSSYASYPFFYTRIACFCFFNIFHFPITYLEKVWRESYITRWFSQETLSVISKRLILPTFIFTLLLYSFLWGCEHYCFTNTSNTLIGHLNFSMWSPYGVRI